jgi:hypothetical protein
VDRKGRAVGGAAGDGTALAVPRGRRACSVSTTLSTKPWGSVLGLGAGNFGCGKGVYGPSTIESATRGNSPASWVVTTVPKARAMAETSSG